MLDNEKLCQEIRQEVGLPNEDKRSSLKKNLLKAGAIGVGVVALSGAGNAASAFWRNEDGSLVDLKPQTIPDTAGSIGFSVDNGTSAFANGFKQYIVIPFNCTITGWYLTGYPSGSLVIDVWKKAGAQPSSSDTIAGSEKPTLSSQTVNSDTSLNTWTTTILAGDVIGFNVDSVSGVAKATLTIKVTK